MTAPDPSRRYQRPASGSTRPTVSSAAAGGAARSKAVSTIRARRILILIFRMFSLSTTDRPKYQQMPVPLKETQPAPELAEGRSPAPRGPL